MASRYELPKRPEILDTAQQRRLDRELAERFRVADLARQAGNLRSGSNKYLASSLLSGDVNFARALAEPLIYEPMQRDAKERAVWAQAVADKDAQIAALDKMQMDSFKDYLKEKGNFSEKQIKEFAKVYMEGIKANSNIQEAKIKSDTELTKQRFDIINAVELMGDSTPQMKTAVEKTIFSLNTGNPLDLSKSLEQIEFGNWTPTQKTSMKRAVNTYIAQNGLPGSLEDYALDAAQKLREGSANQPATTTGAGSLDNSLSSRISEDRAAYNESNASRLEAMASNFKLAPYEVGDEPGFDVGTDVDSKIQADYAAANRFQKNLQSRGVKSAKSGLDEFAPYAQNPYENVQSFLDQLPADHPLNAYPERRKTLEDEKKAAQLKYTELSKPKPYTFQQAQGMIRDASQATADAQEDAALPSQATVAPAAAVVKSTPPTQGEDAGRAAPKVASIDDTDKSLKDAEARKIMAQRIANTKKQLALAGAGTVFGSQDNPFNPSEEV